MAFTVLKVSKADADQVEVVGEFPSEEEARKFAEESQHNDLKNENDYLIELPPSRAAAVR